MKSKILIVMSLLITIVFFGCGTSDSDQTTKDSPQDETTTSDTRIYTGDGFSALVPKDWNISRSTNESAVFQATNEAGTFHFDILKFPSNQNLDSPQTTLQAVYDESVDNSAIVNFKVIQAPKLYEVDGHQAAQGISSSDVIASNGEPINITQNNIIIFSDPFDYQMLFEVKTDYFEQENQLFEEFINSFKFE